MSKDNSPTQSLKSLDSVAVNELGAADPVLRPPPGKLLISNVTPLSTLHERDNGVHLLVICHGLYGNPSHTNYLAEQYSQTYPDLVVLNASSFSTDLTFDGIDVCGERLIDEITHFQSENKVKRISFLGYSLGGLIIRYVIGRLYANKFFDSVQPMNFVTMATPHLGVSGHPAWIANYICYRSGRQCTFTDDEYGAPLLWVLTDPSLPFMQGLRQFQKIVIAANVYGDRTVPYLTASIRTENPYDHVPTTPIDPTNPVIVRPASEPVIKSMAETALANAETVARVSLFLGLIMPVVLVVWSIMGPVGYYQSRKAHSRYTKSSGDATAPPGGAAVDPANIARLKEAARELDGLAGKDEEWRRRMVAAFEAELGSRLHRVDVMLGEWKHTHAFIVARHPKTHAAGKPAVAHVVSLFLQEHPEQK
ncbi:putative serine esterase-domain-containing protein [Blastocladiella britannica]|nr:putative serine esterase-domain-containing protein [Blastocladiella britannica]